MLCWTATCLEGGTKTKQRQGKLSGQSQAVAGGVIPDLGEVSCSCLMSQSKALIKDVRCCTALWDCWTKCITWNGSRVLDQAKKNELIYCSFIYYHNIEIKSGCSTRPLRDSSQFAFHSRLSFKTRKSNQLRLQFRWTLKSEVFLSAPGRCFVRIKLRLWVPPLSPPISWQPDEAGVAEDGGFKGGSVRFQFSSPAAWQRH